MVRIALRNMLAAAARDPLWAITTLVPRAIRGGKHILVSLVALGLDALGLYQP